MKRMSDVFDLPVTVDSDNDIDAGSGFLMAGLEQSRDISLCAAHAINHVDALADALAEIISQDKVNGFVSNSAIAKAEATLKAYRGEK